MNMIERVARAICDRYDSLPDTVTYYERKASTEQWPSKEDVLHDARCAIEAMRTPTDAQVNALPEGMISEWIWGYQTMIDAALAKP